jgi:hypothetical protein
MDNKRILYFYAQNYYESFPTDSKSASILRFVIPKIFLGKISLGHINTFVNIIAISEPRKKTVLKNGKFLKLNSQQKYNFQVRSIKWFQTTEHRVLPYKRNVLLVETIYKIRQHLAESMDSWPDTFCIQMYVHEGTKY